MKWDPKFIYDNWAAKTNDMDTIWKEQWDKKLIYNIKDSKRLTDEICMMSKP